MRTSLLAVLCFMSGLLSACAVSVAWFLAYLGGLGELGELHGDDAFFVLMAARIVAGAAVAPAAVAVAFWLGARGAVREANGALLGRGLYRAGVLLAVTSVVCAFGGRWSVNGKVDRIMEQSELEPRRLLGRRMGVLRGAARLAAEHGHACAELDAVASMESEHARAEAFGAVAQRAELTEHEQLHLIDLTIEDLDSSYRQSEVLVALARNLWLTEGSRGYILKRSLEIDHDHYRQEVMSKVPTRPLNTYAYLGLYFQESSSRGVEITKVYANGPAVKAGLAVGMRILKANGHTIDETDDLEAQVMSLRPTEKIALVVAAQDGSERSVDVVVGMRPGAEAKAAGLVIPEGDK